MNKEPICLDVDYLWNSERLWNRLHELPSCGCRAGSCYVKEVLKLRYNHYIQIYTN